MVKNLTFFVGILHSEGFAGKMIQFMGWKEKGGEKGKNQSPNAIKNIVSDVSCLFNVMQSQ